MASILEPHAVEVMQRLDGGQTFQAVCDRLKEFNIEITPQSVHSWYTRKKRKINSRCQGAFQAPETQSASKCDVAATVADSVQQPIPKSLEMIIAEGEMQIDSLETSGCKFIARPKHVAIKKPANFAHVLTSLSMGAKQ